MGIYRHCPRAYEDLKDPRSIADVLADMGVVYFETGDCNLALGHFERAFNLAEKIEYEAVMANVLNSLSILSAVQGFHDRALLHCQDCLARYGRLGDKHGMAQAYNNLGTIYSEKRDWERALDCFEKGLIISERIENLSLIATLYINKADFNVKRSDYMAASHFCKLASEYYHRIEDYRGLAEAEKILGLIDMAGGQLRTAQGHMESALELMTNHGTFFSTAEVYRDLGSVYRKRGFRRKALTALEDSLLRFERLGSRHKAAVVKRELTLLRKS